MNKTHNTAPYLMDPTHPIKIALIGCGGTGSLMLSRLARIHYALVACGKVGLDVTVYDDDIVESHNVGRQMFALPDVGEYKSICLTSKINRNFGTFFKAVPERFDCSNVDMNNTDNIYITCTDTANFRLEFADFFRDFDRFAHSYSSYKRPLYWMDLGNSKNSGQCILGSVTVEQPNDNGDFIGRLPSVIDRFPNIMEHETIEAQGMGCSYQSKLYEQNLFINDSITSQASHLLWELLVDGYVQVAGFYLNLGSFKTNPIPLVA